MKIIDTILNFLHINKLNTLNKLRLAIGLIFLFSTMSLILVFVNFLIVAVLILLTYLLILIVTVKLFMLKKL